MRVQGPIEKMSVTTAQPVEYELPIGDLRLAMNPLIGGELSLRWTGAINCVHCGRSIRKSFNQGYCYPCFTSLAQCDVCVVKPELCHYHKGTCREPEWGESHCMIPHTVYLANSSGLKVGITRGLDPSTRWIDQGATSAIRLRKVNTRLEAGRLEVALKAFVGDKTNWRVMLKGDPESLELEAERDRLMSELAADTPDFEVPGEPPDGAPMTRISYPVSEYPTKVTSHNLDKNPTLSGVLTGIKGQYLILGNTVINVRKYAGYEIVLSS